MLSVNLPILDSKWLVVDIGGGSEGLAARAGGGRVCAVDIRMMKIREARIYHQNAQWICGDGRKLCIRNSSVDAVTFWFSLGYLPDAQDKLDIIREAFRILKPNGVLSILAVRVEDQQEMLQFNADFVFPNGDISRTGFRISGQQEQNPAGFARLLLNLGFEVIETHGEEAWFRMKATRP